MITWLHFSDLHCNKKNVTDFQESWDDLWSDLDAQLNRLKAGPDLAFFTGDVGWHGKEEEYELAIVHFFEPLEKRTGIKRDRVFVVPGNHDVDWQVLDTLLGELPKRLGDTKKVKQFFQDASQVEQVMKRLGAFGQFVTEYWPDRKGTDLNKSFFAGYSENIAVDGKGTVSVIGLNTAWLSGLTRNPDDPKEAIDCEKLLIGEPQWRNALHSLPNNGADVRICLMHHPLNWLQQFDQDNAEIELLRSCHILLHGHLHKAKPESRIRFGQELDVIPGGALVESESGKHRHGYNIFQFDPAKRRYTVWLRYHDGYYNVWVRDLAATQIVSQDEGKGMLTKPLPRKPKQKPGQA
jgi:predicted phosphodiesterase